MDFVISKGDVLVFLEIPVREHNANLKMITIYRKDLHADLQEWKGDMALLTIETMA